MAVPKTTETRCRDGSVQAKQGIQKQHTVTPSLHLFYIHDILWQAIQDMYYWEQHCTVKKDVGMGLLVCFACTLPFLHLVSVVFGTAIPTFLYIFGKCFLYFYRVCVSACALKCSAAVQFLFVSS